MIFYSFRGDLRLSFPYTNVWLIGIVSYFDVKHGTYIPSWTCNYFSCAIIHSCTAFTHMTGGRISINISRGCLETHSFTFILPLHTKLMWICEPDILFGSIQKIYCEISRSLVKMWCSGQPIWKVVSQHYCSSVVIQKKTWA